ncbi:MAG: response regulator transcription factor [Granulosicoccus sp.]
MSIGATIMVVDDDPRIRELLKTSFEAENFAVLEAGTSEELYSKLKDTPVDLITMDVLLDRENGMDVVRDIRRLSQVPIIFVTGRVDLIDRVLGLELGADDYVTKPFQVRELIARVRSLLRRSRLGATHGNKVGEGSFKQSSDLGTEVVKFHGWTVNMAAREVRDPQDTIINLTTTEYDLLEIFLKRPQRVLTRDFLMESLTGRNWHPSDRLIDNHVAQLRKKIEASSEEALIKTVRGAGYLFAGKITTQQLID